MGPGTNTAPSALGWLGTGPGSFYEQADRARAQVCLGSDASASAVQLRFSTSKQGFERVPLSRIASRNAGDRDALTGSRPRPALPAANCEGGSMPPRACAPTTHSRDDQIWSGSGR